MGKLKFDFMKVENLQHSTFLRFDQCVRPGGPSWQSVCQVRVSLIHQIAVCHPVRSVQFVPHSSLMHTPHHSTQKFNNKFTKKILFMVENASQWQETQWGLSKGKQLNIKVGKITNNWSTLRDFLKIIFCRRVPT